MSFDSFLEPLEISRAPFVGYSILPLSRSIKFVHKNILEMKCSTLYRQVWKVCSTVYKGACEFAYVRACT